MKFGKIKETLRTNPLSNRSSKESYKKIGGNYLRNNSRKFPRAQEQLQLHIQTAHRSLTQFI